MVNFKVGQKVQFNPVRDQWWIVAQPGASAIVTSLKHMPEYLTVEWTDDELVGDRFHRGQEKGGYYPDDFTVKFKPIGYFLKGMLKKRYITNLEYLELLTSKIALDKSR